MNGINAKKHEPPVLLQVNIALNVVKDLKPDEGEDTAFDQTAPHPIFQSGVQVLGVGRWTT